ncbi:hypothetical protein MTO96_050561, partial [Rhipicephalus appendiculatus]
KIRDSPAEFSFATAALPAHEYAGLSRPRRLRESERIQPSSGRPFDSVYGVGLLQLRLTLSTMNVILKWLLYHAAAGLCLSIKPAAAYGSSRQFGPFVRLSLASMCRVEYQLAAGGTLHTACKPPNPSCRIRDSGVSVREIQLILRMHNRLRSQVALGLLPGFPPAANMRKLYWNAELAAVAQAHANQCSSEWAQKHDEANARKTVTFDAVGQNAAWEAFNYDHSKRWWQAHIGKWFAEHAVCPPDRIDYFREREDGIHIGHFTQIIWADTQFIGCGYSYYTLDGVEGDKKYQGFYVCNYAPT